MKIMTAKVVISLAALLLDVLFFSGCDPQPVTAKEIISLNEEVVELMRNSLLLSQTTSYGVKTAFEDLSTYLRTHSLSDERVISMENNRTEFKGRAGKLKENLKSARERAGQLFSLLKRRADENQTQQWKDQMIAYIGISEEEFNRKMSDALVAVAWLDASIQRYDDLVGYAQVLVGLEGIDIILNEVNDQERLADETNREVQQRIREGMLVVDSLRAGRRY